MILNKKVVAFMWPQNGPYPLNLIDPWAFWLLKDTEHKGLAMLTMLQITRD